VVLISLASAPSSLILLCELVGPKFRERQGIASSLRLPLIPHIYKKRWLQRLWLSLYCGSIRMPCTPRCRQPCCQRSLGQLYNPCALYASEGGAGVRDGKRKSNLHPKYSISPSIYSSRHGERSDSSLFQAILHPYR